MADPAAPGAVASPAWRDAGEWVDERAGRASACRSTGLPVGCATAAWGWSVAILALTLAAWLAALLLMGGMDQGPGTPLHDLPMFLAGWVIMLTAMMLPSELTYVAAFASRLKAAGIAPATRIRSVACFICGYAPAWMAYGLAAYAIDAAIRWTELGAVSWSRGGPLLAGSVLVLAGLYQVSSLKAVCLRHCRSPLAYFADNWRDGPAGAAAMGLRHGLLCAGCCWAMMAVMFAVGAMSLTWMALLAAFMFAEKVLPRGQRLSIPIACFLCAMGAWIAVAPGTAPLLKSPLAFGGLICRSR